MNDHRNNPAQVNRWNAWRWPTGDEVARGRHEYDPFWVGASIDRDDAAAMLDVHDGGQLQFGVDGEVVTVG